MRWRRVGRDAVVVVQDRVQVVGLNETGAAVLEALDGARTVAQIVDLLAPRWNVPRGRLAEDVGRHLDELVALGVAEAVAGGPPGDAGR